MTTVDKNKRVIDVADYLFANPNYNRAEVLTKYGEAWRVSPRTVDRLVKEAKEYNRNRISKQEKAKDDMLVESVKESLKLAIISRDDALLELSDIARGKKRETADGFVIPTYTDIINAIKQICKMQGWDAPVKVENKNSIRIVVGDE